MVVANEMVTGEKPVAILSYPPFESNDSHCRLRYPEVPYHVIDSETNALDEVTLKSLGEIDFVSTVCPCAGLSSFSTSKTRGHGAAANQWMYKTAEMILGQVKPKVLFGENAPALATASGAKVAEDLFEIGLKHGYSFTVYKTTTALHGIPQKRLRSFYFFWKSDSAPIMSWFDRDRKNLAEYLLEVPVGSLYHDVAEAKIKLESDYTWKWAKHQFGSDVLKELGKKDNASIFDVALTSGLGESMLKWLEENNEEAGAKRVRALLQKVASGGNYWDSSMYYFRETFATLIARSLNSIHPTEERCITTREAMWLMGLPHDFELTDEKLKNHICQNVPVPTAADMTQEVVKFCQGKLKTAGSTFLKQDNISKKNIHINYNNSLTFF